MSAREAMALREDLEHDGQLVRWFARDEVVLVRRVACHRDRERVSFAVLTILRVERPALVSVNAQPPRLSQTSKTVRLSEKRALRRVSQRRNEWSFH